LLKKRDSASAARRVRAILAYDGTSYSGFQRQANAPTVQAALEEAIGEVTGEESGVIGAGRTDAGVHAVGQVVAFDTSWIVGEGGSEARETGRAPGDLQRALNAVLPKDIAIRELRLAASGFHPRYDARSRSYRYSVYNAPVRDPLSRWYALHVRGAIETEAMQEAALLLVGEHDFAAFGRPTQGGSTVRRVIEAGWLGEPPRLRFGIEANAFLFRMVRSIVGTLLEVGRGRARVDDVRGILASGDRGQAGATAPAHGLCLMEVKY
jgi:tRNA pseudouridine38-40 synthase